MKLCMFCSVRLWWRERGLGVPWFYSR